MWRPLRSVWRKLVESIVDVRASTASTPPVMLADRIRSSTRWETAPLASRLRLPRREVKGVRKTDASERISEGMRYMYASVMSKALRNVSDATSNMGIKC